MIHVVLGTKAQLVKMAPVMARMRERGVPYRLVHTGQHQSTMDEMLAEFGLPGPDVVLHRGPDVVSVGQMALWMAKILAQCLLRREAIFGAEREGMVLVHGDTFSTLLGALMGRAAGLRVGHVESGLRSFRLLHPFPEEITRLLTFRLAHVLFCPGAWALGNVAALPREKVDTGANTLCDTVAMALAHARGRGHVPEVPYALVSLHRYENIFFRETFEQLVSIVERLSEDRRVLFVLHPPTARQLARLGLEARLRANANVELRPRCTYFDFVTLLEGAEFVATDGGSIQEESSYLGVPCLLLRRATERREGIGENALLANLEREVILEFARDPGRWRRPPAMPERRPSDVVIDTVLAEHGGRPSPRPRSGPEARDRDGSRLGESG